MAGTNEAGCENCEQLLVFAPYYAEGRAGAKTWYHYGGTTCCLTKPDHWSGPWPRAKTSVVGIEDFELNLGQDEYYQALARERVQLGRKPQISL